MIGPLSCMQPQCSSGGAKCTGTAVAHIPPMVQHPDGGQKPVYRRLTRPLNTIWKPGKAAPLPHPISALPGKTPLHPGLENQDATRLEVPGLRFRWSFRTKSGTMASDHVQTGRKGTVERGPRERCRAFIAFIAPIYSTYTSANTRRHLYASLTASSARTSRCSPQTPSAPSTDP